MEIAGVVERVERITAVRADPAASKSAISAGLVAVREIEAWCAAQHAGLVGQLRAVDSFPEKTVADTSKGSLSQATKTTERSATLASTPSLAGALGDGSITASIGFAMFNLAGGAFPSEGFLVAFEIIDIVLVAALAAAVMLARREGAGGFLPLTDGGEEGDD